MAQKTSADSIVLVGGGIAVAVLVGYLVISYRYFSEVQIGCMAGYPQAVRFGLQNNEGLPLSMIELQAQAGREELGLMQNAKIVSVEAGPMERALDIKLGRADDMDPHSPVGVHFPWRPDGSGRAKSACLRYSVFLPDNFDFANAGLLPGLFGGAKPERTEIKEGQGFVVRMRWGREGDTMILEHTKTANGSNNQVLNRPGTIKLQKGRWMTLEQEVVLNSAEKQNGELHVWVDGTKVIENKKLKLIEDGALGIDGVAATVGLAGEGKEIPKGDAGHLWITGLDFGWK